MKSFVEKINRVKEDNFQIFSYVASYLNNCPCLVTADTVAMITRGDKDGEERAFRSFLSNVFFENDSEARWVEKAYFSKGVKKLSPEEYLNNPFFKKISIPTVNSGKWSLGYQKYEPYEGFIYRDIIVENDYREIPQIGFFDKEFSYPTVFEDGREWMAIKPNEIETMKEPLEKAHGNVLIYGLGIGYFTYMVSEKVNVSKVTVVERDENAISLFESYILPQFPNKDKITVIKSDAFEYAKNEMKKGGFDYIFTDLWHDISDGVDLYVKMKKYETLCPNSQFEYWIEKSILSSIRWSIFDGIYKKVQKGDFVGTSEEISKYLSDNYLKQFVKFI